MSEINTAPTDRDLIKYAVAVGGSRRPIELALGESGPIHNGGSSVAG